MATATDPGLTWEQAEPDQKPARSGRLAKLVAAGLIDSFGMTLGWTVFSLLVLQRHGLAGLGACSAAMLVGVALSAPATAWLSPRLGAGALLRVTSTVEGVLRVAGFVLLLGGARVTVVAAVVVVMFTAGLAGYAGMRAEVSAASRPDRAASTMTTFVVAILAVEAAGVASAALLPGTPPGTDPDLFARVVAFYGASSFPIWLVAGGARVGRAPRRAARRGRARLSAPLLAGALIMLCGSGPALLAVGLAAELYGPRWVAGSALAFTAGALLAPWAVALVERLRLPATVTWPAWGAGMLLGWSLAQSHVAGLLFAQVLAGMCIAAFEGSMDAHIATRQARGYLMGSLAASEAVRALGSATAVAALPAMVGAEAVAAFSRTGGGLLLVVTGLAMATRSWTWSAAMQPAGTPAMAVAGTGMPIGNSRSVRPVSGSAYDWRRAQMSRDDRYPGDAWARNLRRAQSRRRPVWRWAFGLLLVVSVGAVMFEVGQAVAPSPPAPRQAETFQQAGQATVRPASTPAPAPATKPAPVRTRVLTLITRNIGTEANPNRVYLVSGRVSATQARRGGRPRFVVRPGEALRIRVDNQDQYVHSFTFAKSRVNLDAWEGEVSTTSTFKAPRTPGTYQFYCRYRKVGMSGAFVVR